MGFSLTRPPKKKENLVHHTQKRKQWLSLQRNSENEHLSLLNAVLRRLMWRGRVFLLSSWFLCSFLLSSSRALSTILGASFNGRITRHGMPTADLVIPRYNHRSKPKDRVVVDCQCGRVRVSVPHADIRVDPGPPPPLEEKTEPTYHAVVDCHCPKCRKYHVADRATYLIVPQEKVEFLQYSLDGKKATENLILTATQILADADASSSFVKTLEDSCQHLGPVIRYQCAHCSTKLATQTQQMQGEAWYASPQFFLNLAAARDDSLPRKWTKQWRAFRFPWQYANQCVWTRARAEGDYPDEELESGGPPYTVTGSCSCHTYRYEISYPSVNAASTELQHCYCQLCRRLSGGPFQTWMPVSREYFHWLSPAGEPPIRRYTDHGRRHVCDSCGGVLTIVYDSDGGEVIWPAAGGLDDSSLPSTKEEMSKHLYGVCHICCRYRQPWYALPNDGYAHISEAS